MPMRKPNFKVVCMSYDSKKTVCIFDLDEVIKKIKNEIKMLHFYKIKILMHLMASWDLNYGFMHTASQAYQIYTNIST